jgi:rare lipoprotein A
VPADHAGSTVAVERFDAPTQAWVPVARTTVDPAGGFLARWRTDHIGRFRMRAVLVGAEAASAAPASPELGVTVYKPARATWYGPGFYGRATACGLRMEPGLLGVAHRRLPCGAPVALSYRGRTIVVPVVDRGPADHSIAWDLTKATADALGFTVTDRIGAVRLREPPPA